MDQVHLDRVRAGLHTRYEGNPLPWMNQPFISIATESDRVSMSGYVHCKRILSMTLPVEYSSGMVYSASQGTMWSESSQAVVCATELCRRNTVLADVGVC